MVCTCQGTELATELTFRQRDPSSGSRSLPDEGSNRIARSKRLSMPLSLPRKIFRTPRSRIVIRTQSILTPRSSHGDHGRSDRRSACPPPGREIALEVHSCGPVPLCPALPQSALPPSALPPSAPPPLPRPALLLPPLRTPVRTNHVQGRQWSSALLGGVQDFRKTSARLPLDRRGASAPSQANHRLGSVSLRPTRPASRLRLRRQTSSAADCRGPTQGIALPGRSRRAVRPTPPRLGSARFR